MRPEISDWLRRFEIDAALHTHVAEVLSALPADVLADLMEDPCFAIHDYEPRPGEAFEVPMQSPSLNRVSRSVVLKRTLRRSTVHFTRYIIAHELAHAHLRNLGRHPNEDPEHAADSLAAAWGFPRPAAR